MGFYSEVQINAEKKAFKMFKKILEKHELSFVVRDNNDADEPNPVYVIQIDWIKWYQDFEVVKEVEALARKLSDESYDVEGYGYKILILNEDDTHEEWCNNTGDARFSISA